MTYSITKQYAFESAHFLPNVRDGHRCKRLHGHNYKILVTVRRSNLDDEGLDDVGFVIDFWDLDPIVEKFIDKVDHRCLNDIAGLENPTAENIARWFCERINLGVPPPLEVLCVRVYETDECFAEYHP